MACKKIVKNIFIPLNDGFYILYVTYEIFLNYFFIDWVKWIYYVRNIRLYRNVIFSSIFNYHSNKKIIITKIFIQFENYATSNFNCRCSLALQKYNWLKIIKICSYRPMCTLSLIFFIVFFFLDFTSVPFAHVNSNILHVSSTETCSATFDHNI